jgi:DNA replication initiation complex subunit (GINS family)
MVVFKEAVPEFLGADLKTYGPFEKGDIAKLPEENAKILIEKGLAEEFKVSK